MSTPVELPDLFRYQNGKPVRTQAGWSRRRREMLDLVVKMEYGGLPPAPAAVEAEELHRSGAPRLLDAEQIQHRLTVRGKAKATAMTFRLNVYVPKGKTEEPLPVILTGDDCWHFASDDVVTEVLKRGCILAQFNRAEIASDNYSSDRKSGIYTVFPKGDYGAIAAWAWGYHRCIDFLLTQKYTDPKRLVVIGHSRGGKTTLLAGATDERIALTVANNSGCGGAGSFRWQGPDCEKLKDILHWFPYWFPPALKEYIGKDETLPFDQHMLKAAVAPRALLTTEALGDLWANPTGTWQTHLAAREAYRFLGAEKNLGIWFREGLHDHTLADWVAALDFMEAHFSGQPAAHSYDTSPFANLPRAFSWSAPA